MTRLNLNSRITPFDNGASDEARSNNYVAARFAVLVTPVTLTARLLDLWLPKSVAWAGGMFAWVMFIYWLPTKVDMSLRKWLVISALLSMLMFGLALYSPDWL